MGASFEIFVGRSEEIALLDSLLEEARAGAGRLVLVSGEPDVRPQFGRERRDTCSDHHAMNPGGDAGAGSRIPPAILTSNRGRIPRSNPGPDPRAMAAKNLTPSRAH
jgi:hypothetical protein